MHTKCPECNLVFTPEDLHDASLENHLEYKRITNDLIKELRLKLEHDQVMEWCKAKLNDYVIGLEAENALLKEQVKFGVDCFNALNEANARYREALEFCAYKFVEDPAVQICHECEFGYDKIASVAYKALKGE